jgi:hypothetical protein
MPVIAWLRAGLMVFVAAQLTGSSVTTMTWDEIAKRALSELTEEERQSGALYVDEREVAPGATFTIDGREIPVRHRTAVAFVDRNPPANWSHSCRYLLVDVETGEVHSVEAQFPPFLRGVPRTLRLVWKGDTVPDWTIAKP